MKKVINSLFVIIAAMVTFAGCAKQEIDAPATSETKTVQFFANSIETKTVFGTPNDGVYPTLWSAGDEVKVLLNIEQVAGTEAKVPVTCDDLAVSSTFEASFQPKDTPETYTYYAVCPANQYNAKSSKDGRITVIIPSEQEPLETTVDKKAQIIYAVATADAEQGSVDMDFHHLTAYGKLTLKNLPEDISVSEVKIVAPDDLYISGKWNYLVADGSIAAHKEATMNTLTIKTTRTTDIWFACGPVDVSGKTLTLTVTTNQGDFVKELNFPANRKFEAGKISKFTVDMTGITAGGTDEPEQPGETTETWTLVTDASTLAVGDKVVIAAAEYDFALSTEQRSNNRNQASITKNSNTITITDDVQVMTLEAGTKAGTYAFNTGSGYLYAASSNSNHLKTENDKSDNSSWTISITDAGIATIKAQGTNTKNWLRYNSTNSNPGPIFSCYSTGQKDVSIYRLEGANEGGGETPEPEQKYLTVSQSVFNVTADQTSVTFDVNANVGWGLDESDGVETQIVGVSDDELVMTVEVAFPANETAEPKTHTVTFIPEELDENVTVTINQAAKVAVDTNFEAGDYWIIGVEDEISHVMVPFASTSNHAYAPSEVITDNRTFAKYAFTFEAVEGGFNIKASDERYYSTDANYKNFQIKDTPSVWTVSVQNDGTYLITDASTGKTIKYGDSTYTTFGVYASSDTNTGVYPILVKADNPLPVELTSISVTGYMTIFNEGDTFEFGGTVTANYNDGSTKDVTADASVTTPDMVDGAVVTVSYTEGTVTKTFNYNITVKAASQGGGDDKYYVKVDSSQNDWSGTYLITATASSGNVTGLVAFSSMNAYNSNSYGKYTKIEEAETGKILSDSSVDSYKVVIEKTSNGYSIKFGEYYLAKTSTSNDIKATKTFTAKECEWTFNGLKIVNVSKTSYNIQWNNNKNQERFACYKNTQKDVVLYKLEN